MGKEADGQHPMFAAIWIDYDDTETVSGFLESDALLIL
jgi:hypothetical protein